jgi:hypothetical protein
MTTTEKIYVDGWPKEAMPDLPVKEWFLRKNEQIVTPINAFPEKLYVKNEIEIDKNKEINLIWGGWRDEKGEGEVGKIGGRYKVAVGPRILHDNYSDSGKCTNDELSGFSRFIDVVVRNKKDNTEKVIKCIVVDFKEHSYNKYVHGKYHEKQSDKVKSNEVIKVYKEEKKDGELIKNGIVQTGIRYPNAKGLNDDSVERYHMNGSVMEFYGASIDNEREDFINRFELVKVISNIHRDKECFFWKDVECN